MLKRKKEKKKKSSEKPKARKNFFENIISEIKRIKLSDIFFIILLITGVLVLMGFIGKRDLWTVYFNFVDLTPATYFDIFIRNGVFKFVYFALVIVIVYWLATKIIKKKIDLTKGIGIVVVGAVIAYLIYLVPAYSVGPYESRPGSFLPYPTEEEINQMNHPGCGDRIDFLFSPSSETAVKEISVINELKQEGIPINIHCIGDKFMNDGMLCRKKYNLNPREGEKLRDSLGIGKGDFIGITQPPQLVIGCKLWIESRQNLTNTREFICDNTEIC